MRYLRLDVEDRAQTAACRAFRRLGELHASAGRVDLARAHHERALAIRSAALHAEHPDIARSEAALKGLDDP